MIWLPILVITVLAVTVGESKRSRRYHHNQVYEPRKSGHFCAVAVPRSVPCKVANGTETYLGRVSVGSEVKLLTMTRTRYVTSYKEILETQYGCCPGFHGTDCDQTCFNCTQIEALMSRVRTLETKVLRTGSTGIYAPKDSRPIVMGPASFGPEIGNGKRNRGGKNGNQRGRNINRKNRNNRRKFDDSRSDIDILIEGGDDAYKMDRNPVQRQAVIGSTGQQCTCPPGLPGPPGISGLDGAPGIPGRPGKPGVPSVHIPPYTINSAGNEVPGTSVGIAGPPGPPGPVGLPGRAGLRGREGAPGTIGRQGTPGLIGAHGRAGVGLPGPKGDNGSEGPQGAIGPRGVPGGPGIQGLTGYKGSPGIVGIAGLPGSQGDLGPIGSPGSKGSAGEPGLQGFPGQKGDSSHSIPSYSHTDITDLSRGVGLEGSGYGLVFDDDDLYPNYPDLRGPPGLQGIKGNKGDRGLNGVRGPPGNTGLPGIPGLHGAGRHPGTPGKDGQLAAVDELVLIISDLREKLNLLDTKVRILEQQIPNTIGLQQGEEGKLRGSPDAPYVIPTNDIFNQIDELSDSSTGGRGGLLDTNNTLNLHSIDGDDYITSSGHGLLDLNDRTHSLSNNDRKILTPNYSSDGRGPIIRGPAVGNSSYNQNYEFDYIEYDYEDYEDYEEDYDDEELDYNSDDPVEDTNQQVPSSLRQTSLLIKPTSKPIHSQIRPSSVFYPRKSNKIDYLKLKTKKFPRNKINSVNQGYNRKLRSLKHSKSNLSKEKKIPKVLRKNSTSQNELKPLVYKMTSQIRKNRSKSKKKSIKRKTKKTHPLKITKLKNTLKRGKRNLNKLLFHEDFTWI